MGLIAPTVPMPTTTLVVNWNEVYKYTREMMSFFLNSEILAFGPFR